LHYSFLSSLALGRWKARTGRIQSKPYAHCPCDHSEKHQEFPNSYAERATEEDCSSKKKFRKNKEKSRKEYRKTHRKPGTDGTFPIF